MSYTILRQPPLESKRGVRRKKISRGDQTNGWNYMLFGILTQGSTYFAYIQTDLH